VANANEVAQDRTDIVVVDRGERSTGYAPVTRRASAVLRASEFIARAAVESGRLSHEANK